MTEPNQPAATNIPADAAVGVLTQNQAATAPRKSPGSILAGRVASVDAYRGLVMLLMMGEVLKFTRVSKAIPDSGFWSFLAHHQSHSAWVGCTLHDMIQPSFSFLVGVALPFSLARRAKEGQPQWRLTLHAFWRALALVLLGVFLRSTHSNHTNWTFEDTLSQIGLGYGFLYLLALRSVRVEWIALGVILAGYWLLFALYPLPGPSFDWVGAGVKPEQMLPGFAAHWSLNTNPAWAFDTWFLNLFPPNNWFKNNSGGYSTLSFIPTLGTMILGLIAGGVLCSGRQALAKVKWLAIAGVVALGAGWLLGFTGICPVVKRIWTPSWTLFSGGWCFLILSGFYWVMDLRNRRSWAFLLTVIGMNSIAAYLIAHLFVDFIGKALPRHLGRSWITFAGPAYEPMLLGAGILLVEWLMLLWMFRRKVFLRI
jgi:heparan-alpha-glucosaminide N-acetyltransferase